MRIAYVQVRGFRGFRSLTRVDIPAGFAVIVGSNGAGKSTVCDAIEFAFTGTIRGSSDHHEKGESIHDYLWWRGAKPAEDNHVEVGLVTADGAVVTIRRSATEVTVTPAASVESLLVNPGSALEQPLSQLCRTTILRDEEITRLSVDLRETDRFEFVRAALGTADFRSADEKAKRVNELLRRHQESSRRDYELQRDRIAQLTTRLSQARTQAAGVAGLPEAETALRRYLQEQSLEVTDLATRSQRALAGDRQRIDGLRRAYARMSEVTSRLARVQTSEHLAAIEDLESKRDAADALASTAKTEGTQISARLLEAETQSPRFLSLAQLLEHGQRLGLDHGKCPLCGTLQTPEQFAAHLDHVRAAVDAADVTLTSLSKASADATQRVIDATRQAERLRAELAKLKGSEAAVRTDFMTVRDELKGLGVTTGDDPAEGLKEIEVRVEVMQTAVAEAEAALAIIAASQAAGQVVELEREAAAVRERLATAERLLSEVTRAQGHVREASHTIKRVQGELVDEQLAALSPLLVELYERLRPHVDWLKVRYSLRGDVRRMLSLEVGSGLNPNFVFSSGQRRAAGLAFLIAIFLSRSWCKLRTLVLDDPVQHVDDYRALHLTEVLTAVRRAGHQVICTVEDRALADLLARRLRSDFEDRGAVIQLAYKPTDGAGIAQRRDIAPLARKVLVAS